jgi:hypothetical protein
MSAKDRAQGIIDESNRRAAVTRLKYALEKRCRLGQPVSHEEWLAWLEDAQGLLDGIRNAVSGMGARKEDLDDPT